MILKALMAASRFSPALTKNYLQVALRKIFRDKRYSAINIAGLAVAAAFFLLVISYVRDERTFDRFHGKSDRIFQLLSKMGEVQMGGYSSPPLGNALAAEFPEIVHSVRLWGKLEAVGRRDKIFNQSLAFSDPDFFAVFNFPLVQGDVTAALNSPDKVVLSRETARKYFGDQDPMGKTLAININAQKKDFWVSGILGDFPDNSSIRFDLLVSFDNVKLIFDMSFEDSLVTAPFFHTTFLELRDGRSAADLERKLPAFIGRHYGADLGKYKIAPEFFRLGLQKFADYHLGDINGSPALAPRGLPSNSANLAAIALMTLLLACFNYANMALGQSAVQFKEIGTRKTLGALRTQIIRQFLTESVVLSCAALASGVLLANLVLAKFNAFTGKHLSLAFFIDGRNLPLLAALAVFIGLAAGSYPAFVLSRPQPVEIFRNKTRLGAKSRIGRGLLVLQFGVSIFLIIGTLVRIDQMRMLQTTDLGYDPKNVVLIPTYAFWFGADSGDRTLVFFKNELRNRPEIQALTGVSGQLNNGWRPTASFPLDGDEGPVRPAMFRVDPDFVGMMGLRIVQGRDFSRTPAPAASDEVLVNEAFIRRFNLQNPIGKRFFDFARDPRPVQLPNEFNPVIVGVVKDYHFSSLQRTIEPLVVCLNAKEERIGYVAVRINPAARTSALGLLGDVWKKVQPDKPFDFQFLEDILATQYVLERNWGRIFAASSVFAVFIACLGLLGLTSLSISRRTKEIGIRKILGASARDIVVLINKDFLVPLIAANLLAWPAAYYAARHWLQSFAVRVSPGAGVFLLGGAVVITVAVLTVCARSVRMAAANPVDSLRWE